MPVFKLRFKDDVRRWSSPQSEEVTVSSLEATVKALYHLDDASLKLTLKYFDCDNDEVTLATNGDVEELLSQGLNPIRLTVYADGAGQLGTEDAEMDDASADADDGDDEDPTKWSTESLADFLDNLAMHLTIMDVDLKSRSQVVQLLNSTSGNLTVKGSAAVAECLRSAGVANPDVMDLVRLMAVEPVALGVAVDVSSAAQTLALRAVKTADEPAIRQEDDDAPIHVGVTCDGCGMFPMLGRRYKSTSRDDFDVCAGCYAKKDSAWANDSFKIVDSPFSTARCAEMFGPEVMRTAQSVIPELIHMFGGGHGPWRHRQGFGRHFHPYGGPPGGHPFSGDCFHSGYSHHPPGAMGGHCHHNSSPSAAHHCPQFHPSDFCHQYAQNHFTHHGYQQWASPHSTDVPEHPAARQHPTHQPAAPQGAAPHPHMSAPPASAGTNFTAGDRAPAASDVGGKAPATLSAQLESKLGLGDIAGAK